MQLRFIQNIVTNKMAHALLWTLVHSLWQGIFIALVAALLVNSTKNSVALVRYKLLGYLLCSFVIINVATFCYEINLPGNSNINVQTINHASANYIVSTVNYNPFKNFFTKAIMFLQVYKNVIVVMWMMVVVFKCINMLTGLRTVYRLKRNKVFDAGEFWNKRLKELATNIGIKKPVILLKSAIAEIPMMAGHFKPVILFPAAAFTSLPPEDIEAILLHELAHIRRNDYFLNMLQNFAEIIFFFNPAVLWLSSLVKEERENCCDDVALNQTKNKKQFIHALIAFKDHEAAIQHASFFSGKKYYLLNRLKRIITNNNKTLNSMEKTFLAAGIIITVFTTVAFTKIKQPLFTNANHVIQQAKSGLFEDKKDTTEPTIVNNNESKTVISNSINGKHYKLIETNGRTELYVDDVKIPEDKISDYKDVIAKLKQQITVDKKSQAAAMKAQVEALAAQAEAIKENDVAMKDQDNLAKLNDLKAMIDDSVRSNLSNEQIEALKDQAESLQDQAVKMKADIKNEISDAEKEEYKAQAEAYANQAMATNDAIKNKSAQVRKEALKAQTEYMNQQNLMNKAQLDKQMEQLKTEQKKLVEQSEAMKQQQVQMKAEMDKQAEIMKQQQMQMKADMEKQNEQLKEQNEKLIKQLNRERDSINTEPVKPNK